LATNEIFVAATLPLKILPPQFNCYGLEQNYGRHIDGAIRSIHGTPHRIRTDLSATLFLSDPATYDGGELMIDDTFGPRQVKLAAGDMVVYSGTSVHSVLPVTRGIRLASFFWIQSLVRDDQKRTLLLELDQSIQKVATDMPGKPTVTELAGIYHNLLRMWADT
jgi:PKHD-type hydroxylase